MVYFAELFLMNSSTIRTVSSLGILAYFFSIISCIFIIVSVDISI